MTDKSLNHNNAFLNFFVPLHKWKIFSEVKFIAFIGILLALRIAFGIIHVNLPIVNKTISFAWIPIMVFGWIFGPIFGFFFGAVTDTITFFMFPGNVWFWMYAIQEPLVGFISGIVAGIYTIRISNENKNMLVDIFIYQISNIFFCSICLWVLLKWLNSSGEMKDFATYQNIIIILLVVYFVTTELFIFVNLLKKDLDKIKQTLFIYSTMTVTIVIVLFSFILGPISAVEYLHYINGRYPETWIKYGVVYYLVPRVAIESIKILIESYLLFSLLKISKSVLQNMINDIQNKW